MQSLPTKDKRDQPIADQDTEPQHIQRSSPRLHRRLTHKAMEGIAELLCDFAHCAGADRTAV